MKKKYFHIYETNTEWRVAFTTPEGEVESERICGLVYWDIRGEDIDGVYVDEAKEETRWKYIMDGYIDWGLPLSSLPTG